jgi:glucokinase
MTPADENPPLILALDYGGTRLRAAIAAAGERTWRAVERAASPGADGAADQAAMIALARRLLAASPGRLAAVGASFGGPVDPAAGVVKLSHHVPGWENTPLAAQLAAEFGVPAAVANDANAAALGEWKFGAGQGAKSLLYVTVSTGIGGGWVLDGKIYAGADGVAGELGHVLAAPGGVPCTCGRRGCLETEAAGPALARKMRDRAGSAGREWTGESVAQAAAAGDALAQAVLDEAAAILGIGLASAINLMNPERVILGGGVARAGERWWRVVRATTRAEVLPEIRVTIVPAALGDDAPLWGALALAAGNFGD